MHHKFRKMFVAFSWSVKLKKSPWALSFADLMVCHKRPSNYVSLVKTESSL